MPRCLDTSYKQVLEDLFASAKIWLMDCITRGSFNAVKTDLKGMLHWVGEKKLYVPLDKSNVKIGIYY